MESDIDELLSRQEVPPEEELLPVGFRARFDLSRVHQLGLFVSTAVIFSLAALSTAWGEPSPPLGHRADVIIVKGKDLPRSLLGAQGDSYRLFSREGIELLPIPFQIDECDPEGGILAQQGPQVRPDSDQGAFDENDELVFMAFDAGGKLAAEPSIAGCESFAEIMSVEPDTGAAGYVYLARCSNPPPKSPKKYVTWNAARRTVSTHSYEMGWREENFHYYYYDYLSFFSGPDLLDRLKVRIAVGFKGLYYVFEEDSFCDDVQGYIDGPVRAVLINHAVLKLGPLGSVPAHENIYWYRDFIYMPNEIDARFNPAVIGLDFQVRIIHDLNLDRSLGYRVCADPIPDCMSITGKTTPEMEKLQEKDLEWGGLAGPEGSMISKIIMDPGLHTRSVGFYLDDDNARRSPEYIPGSGPEIGFYVVDWKRAEKGIMSLEFYHFFMGRYSVEEFERFDRMVTSPLGISVR